MTSIIKSNNLVDASNKNKKQVEALQQVKCNKKSWTPAEDQILLQFVKEHGTSGSW